MYKYVVHFINMPFHKCAIHFLSDSLFALFSELSLYLELKRAEEQFFLFVQFIKDCEGRSNLSYILIKHIIYRVLSPSRNWHPPRKRRVQVLAHTRVIFRRPYRLEITLDLGVFVLVAR